MENFTSEQQLTQLLKEGKINEEEYEQLLSSMNKPPSENPSLGTSEKSKIPVSLMIISSLFIIGGILAAINIITSLMNNHVNLNIGVLCLFIGWGLLKLNRGWRICALVFLWTCFIGFPTVSIFYVTQASSGFNVGIFGHPAPRDPTIILLINISAFLPLLWIYWVLKSPRIKSLFGINSN
jgi:hypothetical protein